MESFNTRFLAILACGSSEAIGRGERTTLRFLAQLPTNLLAPHADLGAKHELHRITEVLYESCWRLARTTLEHDVCVTSFFQTLWRDGGSLAYWEERGGLKSKGDPLESYLILSRVDISPRPSGWDWSRGLRAEPNDHRCSYE